MTGRVSGMTEGVSGMTEGVSRMTEGDLFSGITEGSPFRWTTSWMPVWTET